MTKERFALNRMVYPNAGIEEFFRLAEKTGLLTVELRNDLSGKGIADSLGPHQLKDLLSKYGISIETVNAVQKFNLPSNYENAFAEIRELIDFSLITGCRGIVLCPNNDINDKRSEKQFLTDTKEALKKYGPLFAESGITGLVEPLGFEECSIRSKESAIEAIISSGFEKSYMVVHDTFHHHLGTDKKLFPDYTGLVHISGVDAEVADSRMRDSHRVLIGAGDRISNKKQLLDLENGGYRGFYSFEPFSKEVYKSGMEETVKAVKESIDYLIG
jgi:2-keto-myo-inositol isomerase